MPFGFTALQESNYGCIVATVVDVDSTSGTSTLDVRETLLGTTTPGKHLASGLSREANAGSVFILLVREPATEPLNIPGPGQYPYTPERYRRGLGVIKARLERERDPAAFEARRESLKVADEAEIQRTRESADVEALCRASPGVFVGSFSGATVLEFGATLSATVIEVLKSSGPPVPVNLPGDAMCGIWVPDSIGSQPVDALFGSPSDFIVFVKPVDPVRDNDPYFPRLTLMDRNFGALPATGRFLKEARRYCAR